MEVVLRHPANGFDTLLVNRRPWHRRSLMLVVAAVAMAVVDWVSGVFELPMFTNVASQAVVKQTPPIVTQKTNPTVPIPPQPLGNDSSISPVPLPLILTGTMPGRNAREGQVFIGVNKDSPQTYAAGAILANNARIAEIYTDHVVLEREGQRVKLYLQGTGKPSDAKQLTSLLTVGGTAAPPPAKVTSHEILTDYIRPNPMYDGQVLRGYQVYAGQKSGVFSQMGLQAGDVITAINGVPLNEPHSAIEQLMQLTQGFAVTAVIDRKGQRQSIALDGALITTDQQQAKNTENNPGMSMPPM